MKFTKELAVMMDSFRPLHIAKPAMAIEDPKYHQSWIESGPSGEAFHPPTS
jgi:homogentisate 1,2-dioxygenase